MLRHGKVKVKGLEKRTTPGTLSILIVTRLPSACLRLSPLTSACLTPHLSLPHLSPIHLSLTSSVQGGGGVVDKVVSVGSGRRPRVGSNPTTYRFETMAFIE
ncbi:hypothetical protein E2C01_028891 [Portunus trituberculatus]|uniref:Uncharacterized protein n=1 Tax=Portunus trituberculatus TaxID=210409 RepID=A0A5B7EQA6_PORTR|nr:hypothetical protein [Portunus trituberculatus]